MEAVQSEAGVLSHVRKLREQIAICGQFQMSILVNGKKKVQEEDDVSEKKDH